MAVGRSSVRERVVWFLGMGNLSWSRFVTISSRGWAKDKVRLGISFSDDGKEESTDYWFVIISSLNEYSRT